MIDPRSDDLFYKTWKFLLEISLEPNIVIYRALEFLLNALCIQNEKYLGGIWFNHIWTEKMVPQEPVTFKTGVEGNKRLPHYKACCLCSNDVEVYGNICVTTSAINNIGKACFTCVVDTGKTCFTCAIHTGQACFTCVLDTGKACFTCVVDTGQTCFTCVVDRGKACFTCIVDTGKEGMVQSFCWKQCMFHQWD